MSGGVILFSDPESVEWLLADAPFVPVAALVMAAIRPEQGEAMRRLAARFGVPLLVQPRAGAAEYGAFLDAVRALPAERILINSYSMVLPEELLALAPVGAINIHGGLLPEYRGAHVIEWAIINGEREAGATIHAVDAGIDSGPIYVKRAVRVEFHDTWRDLRARVGEATREMIREHLADILSGRREPVAQDPARAQYWRRRRAEDNLASWDMTVRDLYNLVRSQVSPHPGVRIIDDGDGMWLDRYCSIAYIAVLKGAARPMIGLTVHAPQQMGAIADNYSLGCTLADGREVTILPEWEKDRARIKRRRGVPALPDAALCSFLENELGLAVE